MYLINSKFDFGMYSGYDVGLVYIFDPNYIKWCIHNVDEFCIDDLEDLQRYGVFEHNILEGRRDIRAPEAILGLNLLKPFKNIYFKLEMMANQ